jgi:LAS superfamily LD-carboxypeptidase LdcB
MIRKLLPLLLVTGCAATVNYTPPAAVEAMPNDCANQTAMINWLESQARVPRHSLESQEYYEASRASFRKKIWHVRYVCRPV